MKPIRNSIKAVILRDGYVLLTRNRDDWGEFYLFPGGGQEPGETMADALVRECREEIDTEVHIGRLLWVREYIGAHHEFAAWDGDVHQIEFMFECRLPEGAQPQNGCLTDTMQTGVEWVPLEELLDLRMYPQTLRPLLAAGLPGEPVYLGDVN